jgi:membrane protein implicated in regulation of membrane protease activity
MSEPTGLPFGKLFLLLYVFTAGAVAINLFMLGLMAQAIGLPALSPNAALLLSLPLGLPANWLVTRWVRGLMDEADGTR